MHAAVGKAHLAADDRVGKSRAMRGPGRGVSRLSTGLDEESQTCLSCHDGTVATGIGVGGDEVPGVHAGSHPVGVAYVDGALPGIKKPGGGGGYGQLRAATGLDSRIRLFSGQVGCGSCHSPYSQEQKLLVMSNYRSALCMNCHLDR
jgi:predicted CXXCH cytochrome family protein